MSESNEETVVSKGKFIRLVKKGKWEFVRRNGVSGIVGIIAVTEEKKLLLVEQFRPPVNASVIEIPAGLAGDVKGEESEALENAARRELLEETGYEARTWKQVAQGTSSAGLCDEVITLFRASGLNRTGDGAGDGGEEITLHEIPVNEVETWLNDRVAGGAMVDLKVFSALHFAK